MIEYRRFQKLMGTRFEFLVFASDESQAEHFFQLAIDEISRIEFLLTEFSNNSVTSKLNALSKGMSLQVDDEVFNLLQRCNALYKLTDGAFDISTAPLKALYNFKGEKFEFPDASSITDTLAIVGLHNIELKKENKVQFNATGLKLSFAAIGKGYAADKVREVWLENGLTSGIISASGDMRTLGTRPDRSNWVVGIANPDKPDKSLLHLSINDMAVATSGNYEQYFIKYGRLYGHTIDPRTGYPCSGIKSVSIISQSAELSDALATAVTVMGVKAGLHLIGQLNAVHAIVVDESNMVHGSKNINFVLDDTKNSGFSTAR